MSSLARELWQPALLSAVYLIDLVVFVALCRNELRDWRRAERQAKPAAATGPDAGSVASSPAWHWFPSWRRQMTCDRPHGALHQRAV
jgi:hypothetical protein